jgi:hypothetical protein
MCFDCHIYLVLSISGRFPDARAPLVWPSHGSTHRKKTGSPIVCPWYQLFLISCCPISQVLTYHHHLLPLSHTFTQAFLPLVPNPGLFLYITVEHMSSFTIPMIDPA